MGEQDKWYSRTQLLLGQEKFASLQGASVAVVGLGGVGGACAEALCRSGIGTLYVLDHDTVDVTNINRQLIATHDTIGRNKADVLKDRLLSINPELNIVTIIDFYSDEKKALLFQHNLDFVVDAIDTVSSKICLAVECKELGIPLISCMGTGNRLDPTKFVLGTIADTASSECGCGLARVMRRELKARGIIDLPVLYSVEYPQKILSDSSFGRHSPASIGFCPPVAGYILASYVVNTIMATQ